MVDDKACLVVMVVYLDSSLIIQNILKGMEVMEVIVFLMGLSFLLLDLMAIQQNLVHLSRYFCVHIDMFYFLWSLRFKPHTNNNMGWCFYKWNSVIVTIDSSIATKYNV